jgi:amylosucrase
METDNEHVLGYMRKNEDQRLLIFANFSENEQMISANILRLYGLSYQFTDLMSGEKILLGDVVLNPYQFLCLLA